MIQVLLRRTKQKQHLVKFEAPRNWSAIDFVYIRNSADRELGSPAQLRITIEAATDVAATKDVNHEPGIAGR